MLKLPHITKQDRSIDLPSEVGVLIFYMLPVTVTCCLFYLTSDKNPHFQPALLRSDAYFYVYNAWFKAFIDPAGGVTQKLIPTSLYVDYLAVFFHLFGFSKASAFIANSALLAISSLCLSLSTRALFGRRAAIICSLLISLCGPLLFFTGTTMKTVFVVFLFSLFLMCLSWYYCTRNSFWLLPTCLVVFMGSIDRHNSVVLLVPVFLVALCYASRVGKTHALAAIGSTIFSFLVMVSIVDWKEGEVEPEFNAPLGLNFYVGNNERSNGGYTSVYGLSNDLYGHRIEIDSYTELKLGRKLTKDEISAYWFEQSLEFIERQPSDYASLQLTKLVLIFAQYTYGSPEQFAAWRWNNPLLSIALIDYSVLLALCAVALFASGRRYWRRMMLLLTCFAVYAASIWIFFVTERYKLPLYVFLLPLAALGFHRILELNNTRKLAALVIFLAVLVVSIWGTRIMEHGYGWPSDYNEYRTGLQRASQRLAPMYRAMGEIATDTASATAYETLAKRLRTSFYLPDATKVLMQAMEHYPDDPQILELAFSVAASLENKVLIQDIEETLSNVRNPGTEQRKLLEAIQIYHRRNEALRN